MVRRKANPFAERLRRLPHRALIKRDEPFAPADEKEFEAACLRIAARTIYVSFAGSRGYENRCRVIAFDAGRQGARHAGVDRRIRHCDAPCA